MIINFLRVFDLLFPTTVCQKLPEIMKQNLNNKDGFPYISATKITSNPLKFKVKCKSRIQMVPGARLLQV